jgi:coatomer subunit beta'
VICKISILNDVIFHRFVVVCGDGEYIIYTAMALRNKSFGSAQEFVWASDSSE